MSSNTELLPAVGAYKNVGLYHLAFVSAAALNWSHLFSVEVPVGVCAVRLDFPLMRTAIGGKEGFRTVKALIAVVG